MPKKGSEDTSEEVLKSILGDILAEIEAKINVTEFDVQLEPHHQILIFVNAKRKVIIEVSDGKCEVWATRSPRFTDKDIYTYDYTDPDFMDHVVGKVGECIALHFVGIFIEYMGILDNLRENKEKERSVLNACNYPHYHMGSLTQSRLDDINRFDTLQKMTFEKMVEMSKYIKFVKELIDI